MKTHCVTRKAPELPDGNQPLGKDAGLLSRGPKNQKKNALGIFRLIVTVDPSKFESGLTFVSQCYQFDWVISKNNVNYPCYFAVFDICSVCKGKQFG